MVNKQYDEAKAVFQDLVLFEKTQKTIALLKLLEVGNQDIATRNLKPIGIVTDRLRSKRTVD
jgi:hypothetical protein